MPFSPLILGATKALSLGANAGLQAAKFALCLAVGTAVGLVALLYFRKSEKAERFVTDLFATLVLGGGYIFCIHFFFEGKFEFYGLAAYVLGTAIIPAIFKGVQRILSKRRARENPN